MVSFHSIATSNLGITDTFIFQQCVNICELVNCGIRFAFDSYF